MEKARGTSTVQCSHQSELEDRVERTMQGTVPSTVARLWWTLRSVHFPRDSGTSGMHTSLTCSQGRIPTSQEEPQGPLPLTGRGTSTLYLQTPTLLLRKHSCKEDESVATKPLNALGTWQVSMCTQRMTNVRLILAPRDPELICSQGPTHTS